MAGLRFTVFIAFATDLPPGFPSGAIIAPSTFTVHAMRRKLSTTVILRVCNVVERHESSRRISFITARSITNDFVASLLASPENLLRSTDDRLSSCDAFRNIAWRAVKSRHTARTALMLLATHLT